MNHSRVVTFGGIPCSLFLAKKPVRKSGIRAASANGELMNAKERRKAARAAKQATVTAAAEPSQAAARSMLRIKVVSLSMPYAALVLNGVQTIMSRDKPVLLGSVNEGELLAIHVGKRPLPKKLESPGMCRPKT